MGVELSVNCRTFVAMLLAAATLSTLGVTSAQAATGKQRLSSRVHSMENRRSVPQWEVRLAPIGALARWTPVDISFSPTPKWSIGPSFISYNGGEYPSMFTPSYNGTAYGANASYFFRSVATSGGYISAHAFIEKYRSRGHGTTRDVYTDQEGSTLVSDLGYRWVARYFTLQVGGGIEINHFERTEYGRGETPTSAPESYTLFRGFPHLEFKIGIQI